MAAYEKAHIDEIASNKWPHWIPVRHHFGIETFGINIWRGQDDGTVIPEHDESTAARPSSTTWSRGRPSSVAGERGGRSCRHDACGCRAEASELGGRNGTGTLVLSVGAAAPGQAYAPSGWDIHYLETGDMRLRAGRTSLYARGGAAGPGGPTGLQNPYGRATHGRSVRLRRRSVEPKTAETQALSLRLRATPAASFVPPSPSRIPPRQGSTGAQLARTCAQIRPSP